MAYVKSTPPHANYNESPSSHPKNVPESVVGFVNPQLIFLQYSTGIRNIKHGRFKHDTTVVSGSLGLFLMS